METEISKAKNQLRGKIRVALERISPAVRAVESVDLCDRLKVQLRSAHTILFFAPLPDELDVWPLLEELLAAEKIIALPFFDRDKNIYTARQISSAATDIVMGKFGVREPASTCVEIPLDRFDLVLVPGAAFDLGGNRLGRGKGFYDRLLAAASGVKCGVGYDGQLLEKIPAEPHDARVDFIFTPSRCVHRKL
ncbi:MAG TPA: 5-formyltetrahydrofolate cyclo-ligase [Verrucomicrobiae bacterium]